jgi:hypothetical protein
MERNQEARVSAAPALTPFNLLQHDFQQYHLSQLSPQSTPVMYYPPAMSLCERIENRINTIHPHLGFALIALMLLLFILWAIYVFWNASIRAALDLVTD